MALCARCPSQGCRGLRLHSHSCIRCWSHGQGRRGQEGSWDIGGSRSASPNLFSKELFTIVHPHQKTHLQNFNFVTKEIPLQRIQKLGGRILLLSTLSSEYSYGDFSPSDLFHHHVRNVRNSWHVSWALSYGMGVTHSTAGVTRRLGFKPLSFH